MILLGLEQNVAKEKEIIKSRVILNYFKLVKLTSWKIYFDICCMLIEYFLNYSAI